MPLLPPERRANLHKSRPRSQVISISPRRWNFPLPATSYNPPCWNNFQQEFRSGVSNWKLFFGRFRKSWRPDAILWRSAIVGANAARNAMLDFGRFQAGGDALTCGSLSSVIPGLRRGSPIRELGRRRAAKEWMHIKIIIINRLRKIGGRAWSTSQFPHVTSSGHWTRLDALE
jgi:hypothetical protein